MENKKGFTLVELLAILVILAILLIIAIPQILKVLDNSRNNSWKDSVRLVLETIEVNTGYNSENSPIVPITLNDLCKNNVTNNIKSLANIGDMTITCNKESNKYKFTLTGKNEFEGKSGLISCIQDGECNIDNFGN